MNVVQRISRTHSVKHNSNGIKITRWKNGIIHYCYQYWSNCIIDIPVNVTLDILGAPLTFDRDISIYIYIYIYICREREGREIDMSI